MWQQSLLGVAGLLLLTYLFSENRKGVDHRGVALALVLQFLLALLLLKIPLIREFFVWLNEMVLPLQRATEEGTGFVFGYLGGAELPFEVRDGTSSFILAFRARPLVLVVSALSALLFYWNVLPRIVKAFAWLLSPAPWWDCSTKDASCCRCLQHP